MTGGVVLSGKTLRRSLIFLHDAIKSRNILLINFTLLVIELSYFIKCLHDFNLCIFGLIGDGTNPQMHLL